MDNIDEIVSRLEAGKAHGNPRHNLTHHQILRIAQSRGSFHVGRRYRDDKYARRCGKLTQFGLLRKHRGQRYGDGTRFTLTELGREALKLLDQKVQAS